MKQIIQSLKTGSTTLEEVPVPLPNRGEVLIKTTRSLVSMGTERMLVDFGKSNLLSKAKKQPDKVKQVLDRVKTDGLLETVQTVVKRLDEPLVLGYCNAGRVAGVGDDVSGFTIGDRVVSNGNHAEYVCVPVNLVAKIPDGVDDEEAAFTVVGAISLQGIRLCNPTFGETIVVIGLGLIGLISAQLLQANGCRVIGIEPDADKCKIAGEKGIITVNPSTDTNEVTAVMQITNNTGADGVIITASASNDTIISKAAQMSRKRGRIILVGVVGLNIKRSDFYEKELSFQVSCSYGPGRYDVDYEQKGVDYPLPYVRWTQKRNFEAILEAIASGKLDVKSLISERIPFREYYRIYDNIVTSKSIASVLCYNDGDADAGVSSGRTFKINDNKFGNSRGIIGIIGAGNFTKMTLLPLLKGSGAGLKHICSAGGVTAAFLGKKFGFSHITTDYKTILEDPDVDLVMITTRHNLHAKLTIDSLNAGKHVFVEKPLAIARNELDEVIETYDACNKNNNCILTVGFNRRFSPHGIQMKKLLGPNHGPMNIVATMNAGAVSAHSWIHDMTVGGGRIIGEACHLVDFITFLTGSAVVSVCMNAMGPDPGVNTDNASLLLKYANGSNGVVNYFSSGSKSYPKERVEVFHDGRTLVLDNFRRTYGFGFKGFKKLKTRIDKGHANQFRTLIERIQNGGNALIPFREIVNTTRASFAAIESLKTGTWVEVG